MRLGGAGLPLHFPTSRLGTAEDTAAASTPFTAKEISVHIEAFREVKCVMTKRRAQASSSAQNVKSRRTAVSNKNTTEETVPKPSEGYVDGSAHSTKGVALNRVLLSVVKVFVTATHPNYSMPWQMKRQQKSTSSGFAIAGRRLLTNGHSVANQTSVQVRKHGSSKKHHARVVAVAHECDLAMLSVEGEDSEEFWDGIEALSFGSLPELQDPVTVVGYPTGGDNICVTRGVVSRVEIQSYSHAALHLLTVQIDAAINSGNSGGPAMMDDKVVGIAFETLNDAENIGFVIPEMVIRHFLEDVERNGQYTGFCDLGRISYQAMESKMLRASLGMTKDMTGILVNHIADATTDAAGVLKKHDVLLAFDDVPIADDGTIPFRHGERISFKYLVTQKFIGEVCKLTVLRGGKKRDLKSRLGTGKWLVPVHQYEKLPEYFIYGGLVFVPLTRPYLQNEYGKDWECRCPIRMAEKACSGTLSKPGEQVVILSQVLSDEFNAGYQSISNTQVMLVNDKEIHNLEDLVRTVNAATGKYIMFQLENQKLIAIERKGAEEAMSRILSQHGISSHISVELETALKSKKPKAAKG